MRKTAERSRRVLTGCSVILLVIVLWAALVATLAQVVGKWPVFVQSLFYLIMGIAWIVPLKPVVRWIQTGTFHRAE